MSIPKIIHYCWVGEKEKPQEIQEYMKSWRLLKDYRFIEWNEANFDIESFTFTKTAYSMKRYSKISNYMRLKALYDYGGIYLDTDVEVRKSFDSLLHHQMFMGFIFNCLLGTAVIGCEKGNPVIGQLLKQYENGNNDLTLNQPNNNLFTRYFLDHFPDFRLNNQKQELECGATIYPKEYFEVATHKREMGYCIHHCFGSWYHKSPGVIANTAKLFLGQVLYSRITHYYSLKINPFYKDYLSHKQTMPSK